jgi:RHS repeat-associated protein
MCRWNSKRYIDEPVVRKTAGTGGTLVYFHRNHQYSITAVTTSTGSIAERYAYTAYGQPTILDASASVLSSSAINNRYTYTGREWDATLALHHFRARWMSPSAGRFITRDPIGYQDGLSVYAFLKGNSLDGADALGLCKQKKCILKSVKAFTLKQDCGIVDKKTFGYGFGIESDFTFCKEGDGDCSCCVFKQYVLESTSQLWITLGGIERPIVDSSFNSDDGKDDDYGKPGSNEPGGKYRECGFYMNDYPDIEILTYLDALAKKQPGIIRDITSIRVRMVRTFWQGIFDVCNLKPGGKPSIVWAGIFRKECEQSFEIKGGALIPIKPKK